MKRTWILQVIAACAAMACVIAVSLPLYAQGLSVSSNNPTITYQGKLERADGTIANGSYTFKVTLYSDANGVTPVWSDQIMTQVNQGIFNCALGSHIPLPQTQMDKPLWVGITIDGNELRPLSRLSASPMAIAVADSSITASKMATDYVASVSVDGKKITANRGEINLKSANGIKLGYDATTNSVLVATDIAGGSGKITPQVTTGLGVGNTSLGPVDIIAGGEGNEITNSTSPLSGNWNGILGGDTNHIDDNAKYSAIGGGRFNYIDQGLTDATIGGGNTNTVHALGSTIGGGHVNTINSPYGLNKYSFIGGGDSNIIDYEHSVIGGGSGNDDHGIYAVTGGGQDNGIDDDYSFIGGGHNNLIYYYSPSSAIGGGHDNKIQGASGATANESVIGGGNGNVINRQQSVIGGGRVNGIAGDFGVIGGGGENHINSSAATYAVIGGGYKNFILSQNSTLSGGYGNTIGGPSTFFGGNTLGGGMYNTISSGSDVSAIGGGTGNHIQGVFPHNVYAATIPGGNQLYAQSDGQIVMGLNNRSQGSYTIGSAVNDDRLLIIGNGTGVGSESNAFEVSYNGHSIVYHRLGSNQPVNLGGTYQDNVIYAWGNLNPPPAPIPPGWNIIGIGNTFGITSARFMAPNHYQITIAPQDPSTDPPTPCTLTTTSVTATVIPDPADGANPICTEVTAKATGNTIDIWVFKACDPAPMSVMLHVTGRK